MIMHQLKQGFTLIELSIVLVIIGLIAGGVLVGRDLILAAQIRQQITQLEKYNTAAMTFKGKYNCLPGDCADAVSKGLGVIGDPGDDGDGDGELTINPDDVTTPEVLNFWHHLSRASLIEGNFPGYTGLVSPVPGVDSPLLKLAGTGRAATSQNARGGVWVMPINDEANLVVNNSSGNLIGPYDSAGGHAWFLTSNIVYGQSGVYVAPLTWAIDSKIDDGMPMDGIMRSVSYGIGPVQLYNVLIFPNACINDNVDPMTYNLRSQQVVLDGTSVCASLIKTTF
jgi:prepilin-type N-terminal cleavage/methylation domain-containing protein